MMQTRHVFKFFAIVLLATIGSPTAGEPTASEPIERARAVAENTTARRGELEYLMSQVERAIVRLTEIEAQNEALRAKNAMLQWQLGEISDAHRALEKSSLAATREMQQQLAAVTEELKSERGVSGALVVKASALKQQLNKMTSARTTLENEFKSAEQRTKQQLNDLQLQLAALTVEMESERAVRDALARQGNTLTETVSALRRERSALNADLNQDAPKSFDTFVYLVPVRFHLALAISIDNPKHFCAGREQGGDVGKPCPVAVDGRVRNLEPLLARMERDRYAHFPVVLVDNRTPEHGSQKRRHTLLAVDQNTFALRLRSILQSNRRVAPRDKLTNRVAKIERVDEIAHLRRIPNERALDLGDRNLVGLDPGEQSLDRMLIDRIALNGHGFSRYAMSQEPRIRLNERSRPAPDAPHATLQLKTHTPDRGQGAEEAQAPEPLAHSSAASSIRDRSQK